MGSHSNPVPKDMAANLQISFVSVMEEPSQQNNQGESATTLTSEIEQSASRMLW